MGLIPLLKNSTNMIIAIDFDGTLHTGTYPAIGGAQPYAVQVMQELAAAGHYLIIWTCREAARQTEMINWLLDHKIPFHRVNEHNPEQIATYGGSSRKVYAHLYIDDRQVGGLPSWDKIADYVKKLEKEYNC